jgi:KaiC/GvpD/RAD55 family RecA-like ATPase
MARQKGTRKRKNGRRLSSGIDELDVILDGRLVANRLFLIMGAFGTVKTTLPLQFVLEGANHSEPGLNVTYSESNEEIRPVTDSHGWDFRGIHLQDPMHPQFNKTQSP